MMRFSSASAASSSLRLQRLTALNTRPRHYWPHTSLRVMSHLISLLITS